MVDRILPIRMALSQVELAARRQICAVASRATAKTRYLVARAQRELDYIEWTRRRYRIGEHIDFTR